MSQNSDKAEVKPPNKTILQILTSESLLEKVVLLILTALLTGIVIPLVIKSVEGVRAQNEAASRAKAKLFEDVSEIVLTYESLMLDVSWFGTSVAANSEMQKKAFERYTERAVDLTAKWRVQISRARAYVSPTIANKLNDLLTVAFNEQDTPVYEMWRRCGHKCDWDAQHNRSIKVLGQASAAISELVSDLQLSTKP